MTGSSARDTSGLGDGDLLPKILTPPPGPRSRAIFKSLASFEAPSINTLVGSHGSLAWEAARGSNVEDADGNIFLDLTSGFGVASIGHRHPRVVAALQQQADRLLHGLGDVHGHALRGDLAERLCALVPIHDPRVHFAISGSDAVEVALKTATLVTGRPGILAFTPSYHGTTLGALAATSRPSFRRPFEAHLHSHVHRLPFAAPLHRVDALLRDQSSVGAILVEPVVGREGVLVPPPGWLSAIAHFAREYRAVFIADEIFTGFGRTGSVFALEQEGVRPDLLCCGKALGGGLPIAAVVGRGELMAAWATEGEALHTATFLANPLSCAAAIAVLDVLEDEDLRTNSQMLAGRLRSDLPTFNQYLSVTEVRGRGCLWGVELRTASAAKAWTQRALARGVIALAGGPEGRVVQIVPPLTMTERQLSAALAILEESLASLSSES